MQNPILTFIHISDTHIPADPETETNVGKPHYGAVALVEHIKKLPIQPDFVLHTGDIAYTQDNYDYAACRAIFDTLNLPIYYVAGNGDEATALQNDLMQNDDVILPFHYELEVKGVQVLVIDSNGKLKPPAGHVVSNL